MKHRALIVYYSHSGNTEQIAHCIQEKTRGDLLKIEPQVAYPTDYHTVVEQAKKGNQSKDIIRHWPQNFPILPITILFLSVRPIGGAPLRHRSPPFLTEANLNGKNIVPFCTHGGGGFAHLERDMKSFVLTAIW